MSESNVPRESHFNAAFDEYCTALGHVASIWNHMQEGIGLLFCQLTGLSKTVGMAIWYSTPSDRSQREMLRAAVGAMPDDFWEKFHAPSAKVDMLWLLSQANSLADRRNDAIHAPVSAGIIDGIVQIEAFKYHGNPRAQKLYGKEVLNELAWYRHSAATLFGFARTLNQAVERLIAWPEKPSMPALVQSKTRKG